MPHINNKGLLEWDRTPKDPYYYYQSVLLKNPFMKILGPLLRGGIKDSSGAYYQSLQVASNLSPVSIFINNKYLGMVQIENGIGTITVPFVAGSNHIEARSGKYTDSITVNCLLQPYSFNEEIPFQQLNVLLGAKRSFIENDKKIAWLPDQPYRKGSWGYVGGVPFKIANNGRLPYGTDKNIAGTFDDPIYQSQQTGISKYRLDVLPGEYELTLYFAELLGGAVKVLPYDLSTGGRNEERTRRVFDVLVNGVVMLERFDIEEQYGPAAAVSKQIKILVADNNGIEIVFRAITGEPVLNALQLKRLFSPAIHRSTDTISDR
jgi:beta-galactosidase